jgi:hypothetical protein
MGVLAMLAMAVPARAAEPHVEYGGGGLVGDTAKEQSNGSSFLHGTVTPDGAALRVRGQVHTPCGAGALAHRIVLAPDGSFTAAWSERDRWGRTPRRARFTFTGKLETTTVTGTIAVQLRLKPRRRWRTCSSSVPVVLRRDGDINQNPLLPPANAQFSGQTTDDRGVVIRTSPDGRSVSGMLFGYKLICFAIRPDYRANNNYSPPIAIAPDGSFTSRERFSIRYRDGRERFVVRIDGHFYDRYAFGYIEIKSVFRLKSGRRVGHCEDHQQFHAWL